MCRGAFHVKIQQPFLKYLGVKESYWFGKYCQRLAHFETQFFITDYDKCLVSLYYLSKLYEPLEAHLLLCLQQYFFDPRLMVSSWHLCIPKTQSKEYSKIIDSHIHVMAVFLNAI